jgi:beta-glucosidase
MWRVLRALTVVGLVSFALSSPQRVVAQSPAVSNLPWMNTSLTPEQRADLLIPQMTLEQKVAQISNDTRPAREADNRPPGCEFQPIGRHIQGIPELAIPTVRMVNGGTGIRGGDCVPEPTATGLPSTPANAATFNPELNRQLGDVLGDEARRFGHQVMLAPGMNLHRQPFGGRNYEYQSEDPYLSGVMAVEQIKGIQAHGVHANAKHFAGNEQETQRRQMATIIPPRALHELYLLPFEMAVKDAQPASIMCAFPEINGVSACSSEELLKTTLRERWGFQGYVITDRRAVHDLAPSIKAGVDWELSHITPLHYSLEPQRGQRGNPGGEGITAALAAGSITVSDLDQMLRRRYVQMFKFGQFETDFDVLYEAVPDVLAHGLVAREIAEQGIVLLKNQNNFLPLNAANISSVALIGAEWYAGMAKLPPRSIRADNTNVIAPYTVTPQQGLENALRAMGSSATVTYNSAGGTGKKADRDAAVELARNSDVVIVMVGDNPHELCDRETLGLPIIPPADPGFCAYDDEGAQNPRTPRRGTGTDQEALMSELVAAPGVAQKMVVVLKTEGMVLMPWLAPVPALLEAWYPGQEDGNAVASILFGLRNPSGKLPMTFGNSEREAAHATTAQFPGLLVDPPPWLTRKRLSAQYTEGLQMGYRWYEANNVTPVFPFGFGLSYTTFKYTDLSVTSTMDQQAGHAVLTVTYTITNTGDRQGAEASQVYLTLPPAAGEPSKRLVGFQKVDLMPGTSQTVTVTIDPSASNHPFSYWVPANDTPVAGWGNGSWSTASGNYTVHVGTSSADTPLEATAPVSASGPVPPASCPTVQPAAGWVCVNGGWLPPDHPLAKGAPAPSPNPPASCPTVQPAADWVCVNGGWLPPDNPLAKGAPAPTPNPPTPPASCPTIQPASDWVCINGGWLPPDHPLVIGQPVPPPNPQLLMIDSAHVARVRDSLRRGEPQFQTALTVLEAAANRALNVAPISVMDKGVTPPSGDKHDYMSQAPYWWPDPSKPGGRPYIRRDGQRNPEISRITDRDNLGRLESAVSSLGLAFYFTGRAEYAQHAAQLVRVWFLDPATRMNPHLQFGQGIPGIAEGRSAGIIETRFLPRIIDGVTLLQGSPAWTGSDDNALKDWMRAYLKWLLESPLGRDEARRGNNQETWADVQVVGLAFYTGQTDVARKILEDSREDIAQEFEPDGRQPREIARTRAWDYSIFDLTAFLHLAALGDRVGVDLWNYSTADGRSLRQGLDYLVPFATGEKRFPHRQITEFNASALHPVLRRGAAGWKEARYRELARQIGGETPRLELTLP